VRLTKKAATVAAIAVIASTTIYPQSAAYADKVRDAQWYINALNLPEAHRTTRGNGVKVAVIDSGVFPHSDIKRNLKNGTDTVPGGDKSGRTDTEGHGTQMAGIIAGHGQGGNRGVLGIAPEADLIPVKATGAGDNGRGVPSGIEWAAAAGAGVINVSAGIAPSRVLNEAITATVEADAVVIAAAGNKSDTLTFGYPAAMPEVLAVGAVDKNGKVANFSVTGEKVGICAPGVDIVAPGPDEKYLRSSGTSEAAAVVSGAAALVRAKYPRLSAQDVIHRLTATADDNGPPGRDEQCGYGVLNIVKALTADVPPLGPSGAVGSATPTAASSAGASVSPGAGGSADGASSEPAGSGLPLVAGIGAAVVAMGTVLGFLVRRRRRVGA
jgi:type VII secretion-associated serine protease mycosin